MNRVFVTLIEKVSLKIFSRRGGFTQFIRKLVGSSKQIPLIMKVNYFCVERAVGHFLREVSLQEEMVRIAERSFKKTSSSIYLINSRHAKGS